MPRIALTEGFSAPGCSRDQHLSGTQSRPAPDRPEENGKGPQLALSCYEPNHVNGLRRIWQTKCWPHELSTWC